MISPDATYFDTIRRYQQSSILRLFLLRLAGEWSEMRKRGIVADYLRHPAADENLAIEVMFSNAYTDLSLGRYSQVEQALVQ